MDWSISVIIPSYNRGYILEKTIPTYIQDGVDEVIVIDDASTDNTEQVISQLMDRYPIISYVRQPFNGGQTRAKNKGIELARNSLIYFGDDDSILVEGSINKLVDTMINKKADIVGALPLYAEKISDLEDITGLIMKKTTKADTVQDIVNIKHLETAGFFHVTNKPLELPFVHACALVKREYAEKVKFDSNYVGNAYREETDFFLGCGEIGASIWFDSRAVQINYPFDVIKRIRTFKSMFRHGYYDIKNTLYLIDKHHWWFVKKYKYPYNLKTMKLLYCLNDCCLYLKIFPNRLLDIFYRIFYRK